MRGVALSSTLMVLHNPLQPLRDLDRTSPEFHEQLVGFLRGDQYQTCFPTLQEDDLAWLVEYLDRVSVKTTPPLCAQKRRRFSSAFPIARIPPSKNPYMNSEGYVVSRGWYRNPARSQALLGTSTRLPPDAYVRVP